MHCNPILILVLLMILRKNKKFISSLTFSTLSKKMNKLLRLKKYIKDLKSEDCGSLVFLKLGFTSLDVFKKQTVKQRPYSVRQASVSVVLTIVAD